MDSINTLRYLANVAEMLTDAINSYEGKEEEDHIFNAWQHANDCQCFLEMAIKAQNGG